MKHLETEEDKQSSSLLVRFALQPRLLEMAACYLGEFPYIAAVEIYFSFGTRDAEWQSSQLWHRDYDDRKMVKLFLYCSDVEEVGDGAFTYIPKEYSRKIKNSFFPKRIDDASIARQIPNNTIQKRMGPVGTAFYIDTHACYHLGSRMALGKKRLAYCVTYITTGNLWHFDNKIRINTPLSDMETLALRGDH